MSAASDVRLATVALAGVSLVSSLTCECAGAAARKRVGWYLHESRARCG